MLQVNPISITGAHDSYGIALKYKLKFMKRPCITDLTLFLMQICITLYILFDDIEAHACALLKLFLSLHKHI